MNEEVNYISYEEALSVYAKMIDASDGGFDGVRDEGGIRAALEFVQNDMYYPNFSDKLCSLVYKFCSGHYFNDGFMNGEDYDEELKIDIANAMSKGELGVRGEDYE